MYARLEQPVRPLRGRFFPWAVLAAIYLAVALLTRLTLYATQLHSLEHPLKDLLFAVAVGFVYDVASALYLLAPFALYLFLIPQRLYRRRGHRVFLFGAMALSLFGLLYLGPVEFFFFDEFNARVNFIAVDYLIYPHEVFVNIWQSYPVGRVLAVTALITAALMWRLRKRLTASFLAPSSYRERIYPLAAVLLGVALSYAAIDIETGRHGGSRIVNELAGNGAYSFFYAAFNNELEYDRYYVTLTKQDAAQRLRRLVREPNARFIAGARNPIARHVANPGPLRKLNVVFLVEESLGADFVGAYGDRRGLTPNIDRLAHDSILFSNVYATGTRTVRGLEAISTSFPPIPGEAIVKRPRNEGLFNWGAVMRTQGYAPTFIYGGYGTFDNMNYFFGHNGFVVSDRTDIAAPKYGNIWGVSDEDLFAHAISVFDAQYTRGEKIFSIVMSTSNHKPFTFPAGVPQVPAEGGGREAGVRYADYAIGKFFAAVRTKPYFDDTVFVIVGDHGARVYGKANIPLRSYELPLLIYAPKQFPPRRVDTLASQIDIGPTVLGLLRMSYDSASFGRNILAGDPRDKFVLVSHNRDVGLYKDDRLIELGIRNAHGVYGYDKRSDRQWPLAEGAADADAVKDAASVFQAGYELFRDRQYLPL